MPMPHSTTDTLNRRASAKVHVSNKVPAQMVAKEARENATSATTMYPQVT